jgi:hypothetical protein
VVPDVAPGGEDRAPPGGDGGAGDGVVSAAGGLDGEGAAGELGGEGADARAPEGEGDDAQASRLPLAGGPTAIASAAAATEVRRVLRIYDTRPE